MAGMSSRNEGVAEAGARIPRMLIYSTELWACGHRWLWWRCSTARSSSSSRASAAAAPCDARLGAACAPGVQHNPLASLGCAAGEYNDIATLVVSPSGALPRSSQRSVFRLSARVSF